MKLEPTSATFEYFIDDSSGYKFRVVVTKDSEWGWGGTVSLVSFGYNSPEAAVERLVPAAEKFIELVREKNDS